MIVKRQDEMCMQSLHKSCVTHREPGGNAQCNCPGSQRLAHQLTRHSHSTKQASKQPNNQPNKQARTKKKTKTKKKNKTQHTTHKTKQNNHALCLCTFMFINGTDLVGLIGVYVDDFLVAGCLCRSSKEHFNGERGMRTISH